MAGTGAEAPAALISSGSWCRITVRFAPPPFTSYWWYGPSVPVFLKPSASCEEAFVLLILAHRQHDAVEAAHRDVGADLLGRPPLALSVLALDDLEQQTRRVTHAQELLSEALLHAAVLDVVALQVVLPERERARGDGVDRDWI